MAHYQHVLYQLLKALWYPCLTLQPIKLVENLTPDRTTMAGSFYREVLGAGFSFLLFPCYLWNLFPLSC